MLNVVLSVERCDVGASQRTTASEAKEVQSSKVIGFAEGVLVWRLVWYGKEFGGDDLVAVLQCVRYCQKWRSKGTINSHDT